MKKIVAIPIALLACTSLLIGCGNKKAKEQPVQPESTSSIEDPVPGPTPEIEEDVVLPKTFDEAHFIDMGDMTREPPKEMINSNEDDFDFENLHFSGCRYVYSEWDYDFQYNYIEFDEDVAEFQAYNDGISTYRYEEYGYYSYPGLATYLENDGVATTTYIAKGDYVYEKYEYVDDDYYNQYSWSTNPASFDPAEETYYQFVDYIRFNSQPFYAKVDDCYYVVAFDSNINGDVISNINGGEFAYTYKNIQETILKLNADLTVSEYYFYSEGRLSHNLITGVAYDEPLLIDSDFFYVEFDYNHYMDHPEAQQLLNNIPEKYFSSASITYRVGSVSLDEEGKLTSAPSFGNSKSITYHGFDDYETPVLSFYPYFESDYFAIDFMELGITYVTLTGISAGGSVSRELSLNNKNFMNKVAEAMGGQLSDYNGSTYLVVKYSDFKPVEFIFPAFSFSGLNDIEVREMQGAYLLL